MNKAQLVFPDPNKVHVGTFESGAELYLIDGAFIGIQVNGHMVVKTAEKWCSLDERMTTALAHLHLNDTNQAAKVLKDGLAHSAEASKP